MTTEARTKLIKYLKYNRSIGADYVITDKDADEIIRALEQEPCEDAISRTEAILQIQRHGVGCFDEEEFIPEESERFVIGMLNKLPSVKPQELKTGKWIKTGEEEGALGLIYDFIKCSNCGFEHSLLIPRNFCPNCGAKMESEG